MVARVPLVVGGNGRPQQLQSGDTLAGASGVSVLSATVTVPSDNRGRFEWTQTITDASVLPASRINIWLGATQDTDENEPEMLDIVSIGAKPSTGAFDVTLSFSQLTSGQILLNYMVG